MSDSLSVLPGWLSGFLEVFRQGTPAVYATTVYGICHWADSKASDEAKALITNLLQPKQYDKHDVGGTIVWLFDKVYTEHLLSWRAFARSALFTICMTVIFLYESYPGKEHSLLYNIVQNPGSDLARAAIYSFAASIITNIVSDYVSLFAVRRL